MTDAANREVLEYDGASGAILRWYAYGLGSNDVLNQMNIAAATRATFVPDIQGSVIASLDSATAALSKVGYLPYGKSASASGPFGYTAQRIDTEINGLYYYRARHYSPTLGRFMQADPIGYSGGINLYRYVGNDPLNLVDPFGYAGRQSGGTRNADTIALPAVGAIGGGLSAAGFAVAGALAVGCVLLCPSAIGPDQPIFRDDNSSQVPELDSTGKVHGPLPGHVPDSWTTEDQQQVVDDLKTSLGTRQREQQVLGEEGGHRERMRQEQDLLRQLQKKLGGS